MVLPINRWDFFLFLIFPLFLFSCHSKDALPDAPAYHNPLVQPYTDSLKQDPKNAGLYFRRNLALQQVQADDLALLDLQKAYELDSSNLNYLFALSELEINLDHNKDAIQHLNLLLKKAAEATAARLALSRALLQDNQAENAAKEAEQILKTDSTYPGALYAFSQIKISQGDTATAIGLLKTALKFRPNDYGASMALGDIYSQQHDQKAILRYQTTFKMDTTDLTPLVRLGIYYRQEKQYPLARKTFVTCLLKNPHATDALLNLGGMLMDQDSLPKAIRQFNILIQIAPNQSEGYYQKGICFERLHQKDSAAAAFYQALMFSPGNKEYEKVLNRNRSK